jgi:hypothetical protein
MAGIGLAAFLLLVGGEARAQNYPVVALTPDRTFVVRGASVRQGDLFAIEPSFLFAPAGRDSPLVLVARPILGVGGSGLGIGLAPILGCSQPCPMMDAVMILPVSFEARIERMYGLSSWRSATYAGPHLSFSALVMKVSLGWMVDVNDRSDHHIQLAIGAGF